MSFRSEVTRLLKLFPAVEPVNRFEKYQKDPVGYIRNELKQELWAAQVEVCRLMLEPPYRVCVKACHKVGKSFILACLICWKYDCFPRSLTVSTAPSREAVEDQLWREVRIIRANAGLGGFPGATAPELWSAADHWAKGFTTAKSESFHGRHQEDMLFIIDEGVGVHSWVYQVIKSMFKPNGRHQWLVVGNPTNTASQMYAEEFSEDVDGRPAWHRVTMSAPDHPNLAAELRGESPPFPAAVSLAQFETWLADWSDPIDPSEANKGDDGNVDLEWPPGSGKWYRPGPEMESRALGRWPSSATHGVWSDALWQKALKPLELPPPGVLPEVGCDVARFGEDYTAIHVRCGGVSLRHERHNGWSTTRTAGRLKELCREYAAWATARKPPQSVPVRPEEIRVKVDDGGVGGGVTDQRDGYNFLPVVAQGKARQDHLYPDQRSELWFTTREKARKGELSLAGIKQQGVLLKLRQQAMAPLWTQDGAGRRVVESKDQMKRRLNMGSPDDMDAVNLSHFEVGGSFVPSYVDSAPPEPPRSWSPYDMR